MPIDLGDLQKPAEREIINQAAADLSVEAAGFKQKAGEFVGEQILAPASEFGQKVVNKVDTLSRKDFFKFIWRWGVRVGLPVLVMTLLFVERQGIIELVNEIGSRIEVVEKKPIDPRIVKKFGENYYKDEARIQGAGQYSLYVLGNGDTAFDITNIPQPGEKDNVVWYLTSQYGITWPFVTPERDKDIVDTDTFTIADKQVFIDNISADLDLTEEQIRDLWNRYETLSRDPEAVLEWLLDLQKQGCKAITPEVIAYYTDPVGYITGIMK